MRRAPGGRGAGAGSTPARPGIRIRRVAGGELARLEAERHKLEEAHREFAEFVENLRKAKDREEFERFMNARRAQT